VQASPAQLGRLRHSPSTSPRAAAKGDVGKFDLLEAALRQHPFTSYSGRIRGEEGRTGDIDHAPAYGAFPRRIACSSGHGPIGVTRNDGFTALDLVFRPDVDPGTGKKVRRNKSLTGSITTTPRTTGSALRPCSSGRPGPTEFHLQMGDSEHLGRHHVRSRVEPQDSARRSSRQRRVVLAYLIDRGLNSYAQVAATFQAFINDRRRCSR